MVGSYLLPSLIVEQRAHAPSELALAIGLAQHGTP
jgi:hypothetical protein